MVRLIETWRHFDPRGWFSETYSKQRLAALGIDGEFVQDNESVSTCTGTLRGVHYQAPPYAQAKLVRCTQGAIFDVAVDLRKGSPTYGRHAWATLSAENGRQIYVPIGFGHGFITLEPQTRVSYKASSSYSPEHEQGVAWNCPDLGISWLLAQDGPILSDKDKALPRLVDLTSPFDYDGTPMTRFGDLAGAD